MSRVGGGFNVNVNKDMDLDFDMHTHMDTHTWNGRYIDRGTRHGHEYWAWT
jgi:hypothetical protein